MRRVEANEEWSLFCPAEAAGLADVWGEEFDALYERYEREGRAKKVIKAQTLWFAILEAQVICPFPSPPHLCDPLCRLLCFECLLGPGPCRHKGNKSGVASTTGDGGA